MALAIDSSTPAFVALAATSVTTASFTPPVGSLLVVAVVGTSFSGNPNPALTSTGLTFVSQILSNDAGQGTTQLFTSDVGANGGSSRTVSVTVSGFASVGLKVWVLTGQHATQYLGATSSGTSTSNAVNAGITTDSANNWVLGAGAEFNDLGTPTTTDTNDGTATGLSLSYLAVRKAAATTAAGAETLNMDAAGTSAAAWAWAAIAIRPDTYTPPAIYKVADRGSTQSLTASASNTVGLAAGASITTGHYLFARLALDNSGTNGAAVTLTVTDPRSNTWTVVGPGNADPGAADAGSTCYIAYAKATNAYSNGDNITFNYSPNATAKAIVVEEWHGIDGTTPVAVAATTATGATTAVSISRTPAAAGQLFYAALSVEGPTGDAFTQDTDTVDGTWQTLTRLSTTSGTAASNQTVMGVAKLSSGTTAQTWNPTLGTTRDWGAVALVFAPAPSSGTASASLTGTGTLTVALTLAKAAGAALAGTGTLSAAASGPQKYITSIAGSGNQQYPADQYGGPILVKGDVVWAFPANAGRWNGGDWQGDITSYLSVRQGQGFNLLMIGALGSTQNGGPSDTGNTWDSVSPWASGVKGNLNTTYWDRVDYIVDQAAARGITVLMNVAYSYDMDTAALAGATNTQYTNYGTNLGNRYKTKPNLIWGVGGDYFDTQQTQIGNLFTAISAAGDTHLRSVQNFPESTSRKDISNNATQNTGVSWSSWNFVYSYNVTYDGVEYAYDEATPIMAIWGDGHFDQNSTGDRVVMRNDLWWAFSSGARGHIYGSNGIWNWQTGALAAASSETVPSTDLAGYWSLLTSLAGWWKLVPDTDSSFVTAGRGTHAAALTSGGGGGEYDATDPQDQYVTASVAPDGSLAVVYTPVAHTITVNPAEMSGTYTVRKVDPATGASSSVTISSTYAITGTNSRGGTDWLLVFEGANGADGTLAGTGTVSATTVNAKPVTAALTGTGSLSPTASTAKPSDSTLAGTGSLSGTASNAKPVTASLAGTGTLTASASTVAGQFADAALAGTGTIASSGSVAKPVAATLAGTGTLTGVASSAKPVDTALAGTGTITAAASTAAVQNADAALIGTGTLTPTASASKPVDAALAGTGSLTPNATSSKPAGPALSGAGTLSGTAASAKPVDVALAGTGTITAAASTSASGGADATLAGAGTLTATGSTAKPVTAALAGTATAAPTITREQQPGGTLTGSGSLTGSAATGKPVDATLAGTGTLTVVASVTVAGPSIAATLTGTGSLSVTASVPRLAAVALAGSGTVTAQATVSRAAAAVLAGVGSFLAAGDAHGQVTVRPFTGNAGRPSNGRTIRPNTGITNRP